MKKREREFSKSTLIVFISEVGDRDRTHFGEPLSLSPRCPDIFKTFYFYRSSLTPPSIADRKARALCREPIVTFSTINRIHLRFVPARNVTFDWNIPSITLIVPNFYERVRYIAIYQKYSQKIFQKVSII